MDNVDKALWITHASFVNNDGKRRVFTHGKLLFRVVSLQDFLPGNAWFTGVFLYYFYLLLERDARESNEKTAVFRGFLAKLRLRSGENARISIYYR